MDERRRHQRTTKCIAAMISSYGSLNYGCTIEVSDNGIRVSCPTSFSVDSIVQIVVSPPDEPVYKLDGKIVWTKSSETESKAAYLYGVQLTKKSKAFDRFVKTLAGSAGF